jgi:glyoxylase-like metal-dependent hydrolase (beta-lactamase superfamily II)
MQEIAPHVYIETGYAGVTLGAINWPLGLVLIDSPFRQEDTRSWRSGLLNLGGGVDRLLVNLDAHFDRTIGTRAMECTVVGQEKMAEAFRNRPVTFKTQPVESGSDWEQYNGLGSIRWSPPDITFTERMQIHWNDRPVQLEYHPGPGIGAIWAVLPGSQVCFIGDAVVPDQPPFFANADLEKWIEHTTKLLEPDYQNYLLVSGRGGLVSHDQVRRQLDFLNRVQAGLDVISSQNAPVEEVIPLAETLVKEFPNVACQDQFRQRLKWGLRQYFLRQYKEEPSEEIEE